MLQPFRRAATCRRQNFPRLRLLALSKIQAPASPPHPLRPCRCSTPHRAAVYPRNDSLSKGENIMRQLAKFLTATGRRLHALGEVISHFFRKGKLGLKLAIKIPFFVEIEVSYETDWNRRR
jgi:hypothetical protein